MTSPTWTHVGNCSKFAVTPKPDPLKHYSSMTGTKRLDKIVNKSIEFELEMVFDEIVPDNMILGLLGSYDASDTSSMTIDIGSVSLIQRAVRLIGTNDIGAHLTLILPIVFFDCNKVMEFIGDEWMTVSITGQVLFQGTPANFGTVQFATNAGAPTIPPPSPVNYFIGKGNVYTGV